MRLKEKGRRRWREGEEEMEGRGEAVLVNRVDALLLSDPTLNSCFHFNRRVMEGQLL